MRKIIWVFYMAGLALFISCTKDTTDVVKPDTGDTKTISDTEPGNFIDKGNGTILDRGTGRLWTKCSIGQEMQDTKCKGYPQEISFDEAVIACENLSMGGHDDWRLPSKSELKVLVKCTNRSNANLPDFTTCGTITEGIEYVLITIDTKFFPNTSAKEYWTSEEVNKGGRKTWTIYFKTGYTHYQNVNQASHVRCIR